VALVASAGGRAETAPALRGEIAALQTAERPAELELFAAETALANARREAAIRRSRAAIAADEEQRASRHASLVARSLAITRARATRTLRALYMNGDRNDPIAVILGAESLDAALDGLDGLAYVTRSHRHLTTELAARQGQTRRALAQARAQRRAAEAARLEAETASAQLGKVVAQRATTLSSIRARSSVTQQRLTTLEALARKARERAQDIQAATQSSVGATGAASDETDPATPAPAPVAPSVPAAGGTRTLVVDAVAYHLPGNTASGLPVGVGVIAVDPTVIPLGTRLFVPGYGPAVAADVGSAIKGAIIDLWMPSTAQALAWGRRTVTITIYG
jgi:3D (Asp-Asp-Asp) domain-containing protein